MILLVSLCEDFNRVNGQDVGAVMNLHTTSTAVADDFVEVVLLDALEKFRANFHGDFVLILAEAVVAGNAAAASVSEINFCAGFFQDVLRGKPDCLRFQMAGHVIQKFLIKRLQIRVKLAALL